MAGQLPALIRRARRLLEERDRLVATLAREWAATLRGQAFSRQDLEELWAGLAEEAIRRLQRSGNGRWAAEAARREALVVVALVKARVEREFSGPPERS